MDAAETFIVAVERLIADDPQTARRLMRQAADADHLPAVYAYACFLADGTGGKPKPVEALHWFKRAARAGHSASCSHVASWYEARSNIGAAKFWLWHGVKDASIKLRLIRLYSASRSVRATEKAKRLLACLADQTHGLSDLERDEFTSLMSGYATRNPNAIWSRNNQRGWAGPGRGMGQRD